MAHDKIADGLPIDTLKSLYRTMLRIRLFEEQIASVVEAGEVKTPCHLYIGQEAIAAGVCAALKREDYIWGGHRSHGHYLAKGGDMRLMMAEIFGKASGCAKGRGGSMHLIAKDVGLLGTVPLVAATIPLAVGAGLASKLRKDEKVSVAFFGDGATEEGHFHESLNLAALYRLPVIFVCENNYYASHMHLKERRAVEQITALGSAHGVTSIRVDGNNVFEVYRTAKEAVAQAREGQGPTLLECATYRWRGHVGPSWDMDVGVKRKDELKEWLARDPIGLARKHLLASSSSESELRDIEEAVRAEVADALDYAKISPFPSAEEMTQFLFVTHPSP